MKPRTKKMCDKCNKEISVSNFNKHYKTCGIEKIKIKKEKIKIKCPFCGVERKNVSFHIWALHTEEGKMWHPNKGKISPLKGRKGIFKHTQETKKKISENNGNVKYHPSGKKCKWYEVIKLDGTIIKVQGTYEVRFSKILNILDKDWVKPVSYKDNLCLKWIDENQNEHTYYPDFWCPNLNKFFEVKGYYDERAKNKMKYILYHYNNVEMIFLEDIKRYEKLFLIKE